MFLVFILALPTWLSFFVYVLGGWVTSHQHLTRPTADKHPLYFCFPSHHNIRGAERSLETVLRRRTPLLMVVSMSPDPSASSVPV